MLVSKAKRWTKRLTLKHLQKLWHEFKHPPLNERYYPQIGVVICCKFFIQLPSDTKIFPSVARPPPLLFFSFFWICSLMHKHGKTLPPKSLVTHCQTVLQSAYQSWNLSRATNLFFGVSCINKWTKGTCQKRFRGFFLLRGGGVPPNSAKKTIR